MKEEILGVLVALVPCAAGSLAFAFFDKDHTFVSKIPLVIIGAISGLYFAPVIYWVLVKTLFAKMELELGAPSGPYETSPVLGTARILSGFLSIKIYLTIDNIFDRKTKKFQKGVKNRKIRK